MLRREKGLIGIIFSILTVQNCTVANAKFDTHHEVRFLVFDVPNVKNLAFGTRNANALMNFYEKW